MPKPKLLPLLDVFGKAFPVCGAGADFRAERATGARNFWQRSLNNCRRASHFFRKIRSPISRNGSWRAKLSAKRRSDLTYHEVPHALAVFIDKFEEKPKLLRIQATLNVERDSQKKILIGHKGEMLKKIGTEARKELEKLLGTKSFLQCL